MSIPYHLIGGNWNWDRPRSSQLIGFSCCDRRVEWSVNLFFSDMLNFDTSHFPQTWRLLFGDSFDVWKQETTIMVRYSASFFGSHDDPFACRTFTPHRWTGQDWTVQIATSYLDFEPTHVCFNRTVWANLLRSANDKAFLKIQTHRIYVW